MFNRIGQSRFQERGTLFGKREIVDRITGTAEPEMLYAKLSIVILDDTHDATVTKITKSFLTGWIEAAINHDDYSDYLYWKLTYLEKLLCSACAKDTR
jgi:hypothetical protein